MNGPLRVSEFRVLILVSIEKMSWRIESPRLRFLTKYWCLVQYNKWNKNSSKPKYFIMTITNWNVFSIEMKTETVLLTATKMHLYSCQFKSQELSIFFQKNQVTLKGTNENKKILQKNYFRYEGRLPLFLPLK